MFGVIIFVRPAGQHFNVQAIVLAAYLGRECYFVRRGTIGWSENNLYLVMFVADMYSLFPWSPCLIENDSLICTSACNDIHTMSFQLLSSRLLVHHMIVGFEEEELRMARLFDSTHPHVGFRCSHCC